MAQDESSWIADGTPEVEPVTTETPEIVEPEVIETPVADVVEEVVKEVVEAAVEESPAEVTEETATEVVRKMLEGRLGEEAFEFPEDLLFPIRDGDKTEYRPISEILAEGMKGFSYKSKTTELAELRRSMDSEREASTAREVRLEARSKHIDEREAEIKAALTDPKSAAAYEEHLAQYASNPMYAKHVDSSLAQHETEAELEALQAREDRRIVDDGTELARGWIEEMQGEYAGVDPERVRQQYSMALSSGRASLDRSEVRRIYEAELDYVDSATARTVSPLRTELKEIRATLKSLQDGAAADVHNETTQHAVKRAKTTPVSTGSGAPATKRVEHSKFGPSELAERNAAWAKETG